MSDRAQNAQQGASGPQSYDHEALYWFAQKPTYTWSSRIRGLSFKELCEWIEYLPSKVHVYGDVEERFKQLKRMNKIEADGWGVAMTKADKELFERFVNKEDDAQVLTALIEAEAEREKPRMDRIGRVNQRKAEL